ncbi:hypothetical protein [Halorussus aquaticus]|uniref:Uncharacterized protein n=1 Tax=Halorussus aquaticus TaxID=2953748 RepID=A0ABD5Q6S3_9EURY|nr:hypothetical protein [Halorussus aquaticus]
MARDLTKAHDSSAGPNVESPDASGDSRRRTAGGLAGELASDAYNIVAALGFLSLAYWLLFRNLPVELFTLGLVATVLVAVNAVVAVRRRDD